MSKSKVKIEVGKSYRGLINGCVFTIIKEVPPCKPYSGKFYQIKIKDDNQPDVNPRERTRSESYLEHLLIEPLD